MTNPRGRMALRLLVTLAAVASLNAPRCAAAFQTGITTLSFGTGGCNQCHGGGNSPTVNLSGPSTVAPGSTNEYTLQILNPPGQPFGGLNVSVADGTLSVGGSFSADTQTLTGTGGFPEITHQMPKASVANVTTFSFLWTAPLSFTTNVTLKGWGNAVNGNSNTSGDRANSAQLIVFSTLAPTITATPSPTVTPTVTITPTATATPLCGNGIVEVFEQCDDGNLSAGDACPADCKYTAGKSAIRGHRSLTTRDRTGCQVEWYVVNPNNPMDRQGLPNQGQTCVDGDPSCDLSGFSGGGAPLADQSTGLCRFQVVVCLNNNDLGLPACMPNGVSQISVLSPSMAQSRIPPLQAVLSADRAALTQALGALLDPQDASSGYTHSVPIGPLQRNLCSAPFEIDVLIGALRQGSVRLTTLSRGQGASGRPQVDASTLRLICKAPPA